MFRRRPQGTTGQSGEVVVSLHKAPALVLVKRDYRVRGCDWVPSSALRLRGAPQGYVGQGLDSSTFE